MSMQGSMKTARNNTNTNTNTSPNHLVKVEPRYYPKKDDPVLYMKTMRGSKVGFTKRGRFVIRRK